MRRVSFGLSLLIGVGLFAFGVVAPAALGQSQEAGSIVGQVVDASGAALPNVKVTATSPALQVPQVSTVTDAEGNYKLLSLPAPGTYRATFELQGFQTLASERHQPYRWILCEN